MSDVRSDPPDTVIVGGGIAGVALAYYLARGGLDGIAVLERDQLASGATGASFAGIRQQFSTPLEIELSKRGLRFWKTCEEQFDSACRFDQVGYLFLTSRPERLARFAEAAELQRRLGAGPVHMLDPEGVKEVSPWLGTDDLAGGCWTPKDGRVTSTDGVAALAKGARALGVRFIQHSPVDAIERASGGFRISGGWGAVTARQVVLAAGNWTRALAHALGYDVDVHPWPLHYALTGPALEGDVVPLTVDFDTGFCIEREGPGLAATVLLEDLPPGYGQQDMLEDWFTAAAVRAPALVDLGISHLLTAEADNVSDGHANAGQLDDGLWVLAGFAGHGVMHGPPIAELLARTMLGDPDPAIDLSLLDPLRRPEETTEEWMVASKKD